MSDFTQRQAKLERDWNDSIHERREPPDMPADYCIWCGSYDGIDYAGNPCPDCAPGRKLIMEGEND